LLSPFQSEQEVIFNAPLEAAWSFKMDLTKIPEFHPRVFKVDLLAGKTFRKTGAPYQCHLSGGKHTCIEKDSEIIPLQKIRRSSPCYLGTRATLHVIEGADHSFHVLKEIQPDGFRRDTRVRRVTASWAELALHQK